MAANKKQSKEIPPHRVLREVYRHYLEFRDLVAQDGRNDVIEHGYYTYDEDGTRHKHLLTISFWDLFEGIKTLGGEKGLSDRKKEAFFYNVILDKKQAEVAKIMGITTVSVGQYVEAAMMQLSKRYFAELEDENPAAGDETDDDSVARA